MNGMKGTFTLAQTAAHAFFFIRQFRVHLCVSVKGGGRDAQRACPAVAYADAAGAAKTCIHHGLFPILFGHLGAGVAVSVQNGAFRTDTAANAAGDATMNVNLMLLFWCAFDGFYGTAFCTGGASDTLIRNSVWHMTMTSKERMSEKYNINVAQIMRSSNTATKSHVKIYGAYGGN
jgi:hypothetical protein